MSLRRDWIGSPNYSGRSGTRVTTIVVHTAQGALTYQSLGNYFASTSAGVSSHTGIDDTAGVVGEYVGRDWKAWTASNANPYSVQAELCAFAEWSADEWNRHPVMLDNCAAWIAEEAAAFGIPLDALTPAGAQTGTAGVCQHADLGAMGGGHWDCGPAFPIGRVLELARAGGRPAEPEPTEDDMPLHIIQGDGPGWFVTDLVTKRLVRSPDEAARIVVRTRAYGGQIECTDQNGPVVYEQIDVDAIPTVGG